ncbi:6TM ABC transporter family protein [Asaia astilbis]|uniref:hypothetical protein n=1 Tax=Asaia astilbis TaxID=610244 RepID=UPI0018DB2DE5|nr:hypothetical protein [Asaia astilbis]
MTLPRKLPFALTSLIRAWRLVLSHDIRFFRLGIGVTLFLLVAERLCLLGTPFLFSRLVAHFSSVDARLTLPVALIISYAGLIFLRSAFSALQELVYQPWASGCRRSPRRKLFAICSIYPIAFIGTGRQAR